ncbi:amidohydrolase family protein [Frondihabitans australicus]|uniref:Cytosine deaminase n=1 Tax=Frondihabitans australicus TaxID=386892 RepID=A0A495IKP3_9MICO|nr:amidohydrolase family protein [Frondihabitans australicus]RKR76008.1 cytosine deaminase [Frondihabitans australicus]
MTALPRQLTRLTNATLPDGRLVDVTLDGHRVARVETAGASAQGAGSETRTPDSPASTLDLTGHLLLTAPAEPHAHLDKALSYEAIRPPMGDLRAAIASWREYAATMTVDDIADRAREQALRMLGQGTTAIRTHLDILLGDQPLRGAEALVRVRDELRDLIDIELVALAGPDVPTRDIEAALDLGVDLVGGSPHLAQDPTADLTRLLALARARRAGVDLHTDESLHGPVTLDEFARIVAGWREADLADGLLPVNVSAGHCVRLGTAPAAARDETIAATVAAGIGVIANPITNLYLQGWGDDVSMPRGLAPVRQLLDAGARVAAGADNVRDPFNPLGRSDALETAMLLVTAGHLTIDEAYGLVSTSAREVLALPAAGVVVGAQAELLAVRGTSLADVVANAPADRFVIHRGALVAESSTSRSVASPAGPGAAAPAHPLLADPKDA